MELPFTLQKKIVDFLTSLPNMHVIDSQRALIYQAGLDAQLQDQIPFGSPPAQFVPLLVSTLIQYGRLNDGRNALEAVLETAKNYVGQDRKAYCEILLQELRAIAKGPSQVFSKHVEKPSLTKKILILSANPKDTARLRLDEEVREIEEGLRRSKHREQFIIQSKWAVRLRDLRRAMLDEEPQIVHFCGHGEEDGLMVEDENGNAILVDLDALAGLFELFKNQVECVLLNACYSQLQAEAINKHITYVIGMSKGIQDTTAIEFAVGFYDALGAGKSIEEAFKFGRNAIQLYNIPEHLIPVLKKSSSIEEQSIESGSMSIPNLNKTDNLVLKLSCEYILSNNKEVIERDRLFAQEESLQVPEAEFKESLDILERNSYVELLGGMTDRFFPYTVTTYGFETYAQAYLPEYKSIVQGVMTLIVSKDISGNHALAESLNQPIILIDYILELLEEKNLLQLSKMTQGVIWIYNISPELKRMVEG